MVGSVVHLKYIVKTCRGWGEDPARVRGKHFNFPQDNLIFGFHK